MRKLVHAAALLAVQLVLLAYAVLWVVLTIDTLRLIRLVNLRAGARPLVATLAEAGCDIIHPEGAPPFILISNLPQPVS